MRTLIAAMTAALLLALSVAPTAAAFEGGGRKPSEAPLIAVGQHYTGQLNNHQSDANYGGYEEVALWRLPPLTTRDVVTVDWSSAPFTHEAGSFPICLILAQGIEDYNWGTVFGDTNRYCEGDGGPSYSVSGSGTAQTEITAQETSPSSSYLEFFAYAGSDNPSEYETYPYSFTVEPILHYLAVASKPVKQVSANGVFSATANLATGLPAPDGLPFSLSVSWANGGVASYTATSSGGVVDFQLALPETAYGKNATFVVSHPADGTYQAVTAPKLVVKVTKPKAVPIPVSTCEEATRHARAVARQYKRLKRHARLARGATRQRLRHRAARVGRNLRAARSRAAAACSAT